MISWTVVIAQHGMLDVRISGLPSGNAPKVLISGPQGFSKAISQSQVLTNLVSGVYQFSSEITIHRQKPISQAFVFDNPGKISVMNDTQRVTVVYRLMPGSDKLWLGNQNAVANTSTRIISFNEQAIAATGNTNATVKLTSKGSSPKGMAFDRYGNLWIADAYTVRMYEWNTLGKTNVTPKYTLSLKEPPPCVVFDREGNLWVSDGRKAGKIFRIPSGMLYGTGPAPTDITLSGPDISGADNMAFDTNGNLWATHEERNSVVKLSAASLKESSTTVTADLAIECKSKPPVVMLLSDPKAMAFDRQGNLWVGFFGPNVIAKIPVSHQKQSATITPEVQLTLTVGVLLNSLAFDEAGGLWTAMASGKFGRLSPGQLGNAGKVTPEIVVSSTELKYAGGLAFYPIPEGLPLR
jgi:sugar lactone lactonase YvrE